MGDIKIKRVRVLRGANIWAYRPVLEILIDIGKYERLPSNKLPGFTERLVEVLPTQAAYREVIVPRTGLAMIPVVVTPEGETWQDSSDILDRLERRFPTPALYPTTPVQRLASYVIELYADEFLIIPGLHYRWSFPESETKARADFAASTGDVEAANREHVWPPSQLTLVGATAACAQRACDCQ